MEAAGMDLRTFFGLFQRQFRVILLTVATLTAIAGVWAYSLTPIYSSTALILVDPSLKNLLQSEVAASNASADSARVDSEVEIMRSDGILLDTIRENGLISDAEFGVSLSMSARILSFLRFSDPHLPTGDRALNQSLGKLRNAVSVQRRGLTYLITVQVRSKSASRAAELANAVAQTYIKDQLAFKVDSVVAARDILQTRIIGARRAIIASEGSFDSFISANINDIVSNNGRTDIADMQAQVDQLRFARESALRVADLVQGSLADGDYASVTSALQSDALSELQRQRDGLNQQLESATDGDPVAINLKAELLAIEDRLKDAATVEVARLRSMASENLTQETTLRENVRTALLGSDLSPDKLTRIYELQQNAELARAQYQTLLSRSQDLEAQANLQMADSRIVSPALSPSAASFPNTSFIFMAATLAALTIGVLLAFLQENFVGGFTSESHVESTLRTRVSAAVAYERLKPNVKSLATTVVTSPLSIYAESVRRIRAIIDQSSRHTSQKRLTEVANTERKTRGIVVMVTSTAPGEGKSTIALSLARSYALAGKRTVLIDCDLRKPSIHRHIDMEPSHGLQDFLSDKTTDLAAIVTMDPLTPATVILGARRSDVPTDQLIGGKSFTQLLQVSKDLFDVIVLDTPPVGPVVDAMYIAPFADVIAFIVQWAKTPQTDVKKALAGLTEAKRHSAEILTILNQQELASHRYANMYRDYHSNPT